MNSETRDTWSFKKKNLFFQSSIWKYDEIFSKDTYN